MVLTRETPEEGGPAWRLSCDMCDHTLKVGGIDDPEQAQAAAQANGWAITPTHTVCPACASTK